MTSEPKAKKSTKMYICTGHEAPIKVDLPSGKQLMYVEGDTVDPKDWPQANITIPDAVERGLIREKGKVE